MLNRGRTLVDELIQRRSIRDFAPDPVPRTLIEQAFEAANSAPSGANRQPWSFVAVSDPAVKREIRVAAEAEERAFWEGGTTPREWLDALAPFGLDWRKPFLEIAPWLVVVFKQVHGVNEDGSRQTNYYVNESVGIACGLLIATLQTMGLSTLTHTPQPMRFLNAILERPSNERPFILFPVGFPAEDCTVPDLSKKDLAQVTTWFNKPETPI
ncbi:MAG: nitroreductase family protein [Acidobacteriota bacterium]